MPFWKAIAAINRDSLGFTPISEKSDISLEGKSLFDHTYDAILHIDYKTSRTIAFRKKGDEYIWIGEQEIHMGPRRYTTADGTINEKIIINYDIEPISGFPLNEISVVYDGPDSLLSWRHKLRLVDVDSIIAQWDDLAMNAHSP